MLVEEKLSGGVTFQVIQYWNGGDFYNTEAIYNPGDGSEKRIVLDPDDAKRWRAELSVDEKNKLVTLSAGGPVMMYRWSDFSE